MKPLSQADAIHLEAAQGWLELGNHVEANEELHSAHSWTPTYSDFPPRAFTLAHLALAAAAILARPTALILRLLFFGAGDWAAFFAFAHRAF